MTLRTRHDGLFERDSFFLPLEFANRIEHTHFNDLNYVIKSICFFIIPSSNRELSLGLLLVFSTVSGCGVLFRLAKREIVHRRLYCTNVLRNTRVLRHGDC